LRCPESTKESRDVVRARPGEKSKVGGGGASIEKSKWPGTNISREVKRGTERRVPLLEHAIIQVADDNKGSLLKVRAEVEPKGI